MGLIFLFTPLSITSLRSVTVGSGRSGGAFCSLFAKVSNFIQKAIVFWGTGVTSSANTFVTICFTERYTEASPTPPKGGETSLQVFCRKYQIKEPSPYPSCAHRHSSPLYFPSVSDRWFGGVGGGFLFPITQSQSQNHKKDFQCVKRDSYII